MSSAIKRLLTMPLTRRAKAGEAASAGERAADHLTVVQIKQRMLAALQDCQSPTSARMRYRIEQCVTATELWLMRSDIFQEVSGRHSQGEASKRVNHLLPCFKGWIPSSQLLPVKATLTKKPTASKSRA
jgi:hypothetical protein